MKNHVEIRENPAAGKAAGSDRKNQKKPKKVTD